MSTPQYAESYPKFSQGGAIDFHSAISAVRGAVDTVGTVAVAARAAWNHPVGAVADAAAHLRTVVDGVVGQAGQRLDAVTADTYRLALRTELMGAVAAKRMLVPPGHPFRPYVLAAVDTIAPLVGGGTFADLNTVITGAYASLFAEHWGAFNPAGLACFDSAQRTLVFAIVDRFGRLLTDDGGRAGATVRRAIGGNVRLFLTLYPLFLAYRDMRAEDPKGAHNRLRRLRATMESVPDVEAHLPLAVIESLRLCGDGQVVEGTRRLLEWAHPAFLQPQMSAGTETASPFSPTASMNFSSPLLPFFGCMVFRPSANGYGIAEPRLADPDHRWLWVTGRTLPLFARVRTAWRAPLLRAQVAYLWHKGEWVRHESYARIALGALVRSAHADAG